jgi:hypothetical protein
MQVNELRVMLDIRKKILKYNIIICHASLYKKYNSYLFFDKKYLQNVRNPF